MPHAQPGIRYNLGSNARERARLAHGQAIVTRYFSHGGARYIGLGFYWAWLFLTFYTSVLLPDSPSAAELVRDIWTWAAWAHAISLLAFALLARRLQPRALRPSSIVASTACTCLGTLLIPFGYLLPGASPFTTVALATTGAVVTGISTAWIVLSWGVLYSKRGARFSLFGIIASYLLAAVIYFLVQCMAPLVAIATTALLPAGSGLLLHSIRPRASSEPNDAAGEPAGTEGSGRSTSTRSSIESAEPTKTRRFAPRVILPLAAVFLYALCGEVLRGFATASGNQASLDVMGNLYLLGSAIGLVVMGVILALIPGFTRKRPAEMPGIRITLLIMAAGFLVTTLTSTSFFFAYAVFGAAFQCYRSLVWMYSADIAERTGAPAFSVFGATQCCSAFAVVLGVPIASSLGQIVSSGLAQWTAIASIAVFLIFTTAVLVINPKDLETAWGLVPSSASSGSGGGRREADGPAAETHPASTEAAAIPASTMREYAPDAPPENTLAFLTEEFGLTTREYEVALLLARGRSLPFIQEELHIAQGTAQTHLVHIYRKLDVHSRQEFLDVIEARAIASE